MTSVPRGKAAVLPDEVLREAGLRPRKQPEHEPHTKYFAFGFREAEHFQPAVAA